MHSELIKKIKLRFIHITGKLVFKVLLIILVMIGLYLLQKSFYKTSNQQDNNTLAQGHKYYAESVEIPDTLSFAGEPVPLNNFDVYESLEKEFLVNSYWHSQTILMLKKAYRYFPIIEPLLKKNKVPEDFKYLVVAESGFSNVVSPAGASGFWQFMKPTAQKYGIEISEEVDERYNLEKSTEAACKHLKDLFSYYKNWTLVAAAYNLGAGNLDKALSNQNVNSYYDLYLNDETARYVFRILAIKTILSSPSKYGFFIPKRDRYTIIPTEKFEIDTTINNLSQFAIDKGLNYKLLRIFNPWLRKYKLTVTDGKKYLIQLPKPEYRDLNKLSKILSLSDSTEAVKDSI